MGQIEGFRLSPQQRVLWRLQNHDTSIPFRAISMLLVDGVPDVELLKIAIRGVVSRHEIFRTRFHSLPGLTLPLQVVGSDEQLTIREHELTNEGPQEQERSVEILRSEMSRTPIDFQQGPMIHVSLIALSKRTHILLIGVPSLCGDLITLRNLLKETKLLYESLLHRGDLKLQPPVQYADFSAWANNLIENEESREEREYWLDKDPSDSMHRRLPFEAGPPVNAKFDPRVHYLSIGADLTNRIRDGATKSEVSEATFLFTCWLVLLGRLTNHSRMTVGLACDGRNYEGLEEAMGLFQKYVPLRYDIEGHTPVRQVLREVEEAVRESYDRQEYFEPGDDSQAAGSGYTPFLFEFDRSPEPSYAGDLTITTVYQEVCTDRFKLRLRAIQHKDHVQMELHYDSGLIELQNVERLGWLFQETVTEASRSPDSLIGRIFRISDNDHRQLVVNFNRTQRAYPRSYGVHQLFEKQVERSPNKVAVVFEGQRLTYAELNSRSNQLAHHLRALGVGQEALIGLFMDRSIDSVVSLLAILKAGGAYVPLDPVLPPARIAMLLAEARPDVLLTQHWLIENQTLNSPTAICVQEEKETIENHDESNPGVRGDPRQIVYVMFTSGSTGIPKGVTVEHQQLVNYVNSIVDRLEVDPGWVFASISTLGADLGNTTIFPSLCSGGSLHVISRERAADPDAFVRYVLENSIDVLKIVPSHLRTVLTALQPHHSLRLKRVVLGGESLDWDLIDKLHQVAPDAEIFNHYGPTETTVGVLTKRLTNGEVHNRSYSPPLGRPISNTRVYVLDETLEPVPIWIPGELYVAGAAVARGYLNDSPQTAEKFIPDRFSREPGSRLYKTGDLVRFHPDGNLEFLGRTDNQVKLRGFRIELAEIETVLLKHSSVQEAIVVAREEAIGKRLVAYLVSRAGVPAPSPELREFLGHKLPDYMVPSAFVWLDAFPQTPNGKLDRAALPPPDQPSSEPDAAFEESKTPIETALATIWARVLGLERVANNNNFFELGGHSLLAMQVISRAREAFHVDLPLRCLFETPTVAGLAGTVERILEEGDEDLARILEEIELLSEEEVQEELGRRQKPP